MSNKLKIKPKDLVNLKGVNTVSFGGNLPVFNDDGVISVNFTLTKESESVSAAPMANQPSGSFNGNTYIKKSDHPKLKELIAQVEAEIIKIVSVEIDVVSDVKEPKNKN